MEEEVKLSNDPQIDYKRKTYVEGIDALSPSKEYNLFMEYVFGIRIWNTKTTERIWTRNGKYGRTKMYRAIIVLFNKV